MKQIQNVLHAIDRKMASHDHYTENWRNIVEKLVNVFESAKNNAPHTQQCQHIFEYICDEANKRLTNINSKFLSVKIGPNICSRGNEFVEHSRHQETADAISSGSDGAYKEHIGTDIDLGLDHDDCNTVGVGESSLYHLCPPKENLNDPVNTDFGLNGL